MIDESSMEGLDPTVAVRAEIDRLAFSSIRCIATVNSSMSSSFFFPESERVQIVFKSSSGSPLLHIIVTAILIPIKPCQGVLNV